MHKTGAVSQSLGVCHQLNSDAIRADRAEHVCKDFILSSAGRTMTRKKPPSPLAKTDRAGRTDMVGQFIRTVGRGRQQTFQIYI